MGALLYNPFLWAGEKRGMARLRRELLAEARGGVLEIGAGTGLNLRHYPAGLDELVLAEPGARIGGRIDLDRAPEGVPVRLEQAPAEYLPFADASFDTVVSTLVLCTVSDPRRAVSEVARVLRPGGRLLFLEHVRAEGGWRQAMQRRSVRPWAAFADGCQCDRANGGDDLRPDADRIARAGQLEGHAADRQAAGLGQRGHSLAPKPSVRGP